MNVVLEILALIGGLAVLIAGADFLVRGAAQLARVFGLSPFAIGVTVVAFGTSAPELFASIGAAIQGEEEFAIGNVLGSNISNILLILGAGAIMYPIVIEKRVRSIELPIMLAISLGAAVLLQDKQLTRLDGVLLCVGVIAYVSFIIRSHRVELEHEGEEVVTHPKSDWADVLMVLLGIGGLAFGAWALVYGATGVAERLGVSEGIIGVTVVALGTSLPELAATVRAAIAKSSDIAVGNVVGSNIFNLLIVLGITSLVKPLYMSNAMEVHVWIMLGVSAALVVLATVRPRFGRLIGGVFLVSYVAFNVFAYMTAT